MNHSRGRSLRARGRSAWTALRRREKGATAVMFAITLPVLLGFAGLAVDAGMLYAKQSQIQKSADLAALSGAQVLPEQPSSATDIANQVFQQNYGSLTPVRNVNLFSPAGIKVHYENTVPLFFMPVLGINNGTVVGKAEAQAQAMSRPTQLIPIGIPHDTVLNYGTEMSLYGDVDGTYAPGVFGLVNLTGTATLTDPVIEKWIANGYTAADGPVPAAGSWLAPVTGTKAGPVVKGINARWADGRTLVICPVIDFRNAKGSKGEVQVLGFAQFEITREATTSGAGANEKSIVWGRFMRTLTAPGQYDNKALDYGVKRTVLVK